MYECTFGVEREAAAAGEREVAEQTGAGGESAGGGGGHQVGHQVGLRGARDGHLLRGARRGAHH